MHSNDTSQNVYVMDSANGAEMARLIDQDRMVTKATGLFPEEFDLLDMRRILDVACGPGGWAREVAYQLPDVEVVGIDINADMVDYANAFVKVEQLHNATFQVMDATRPLAFADASFDLVNARFLTAFVYKRTWPSVVKECARLVRPGGWVILTETNRAFITNSEAVETQMKMGFEAMSQIGFYAGDAEGGVTARLGPFLAEVGLSDIQTTHHVLDFSSGTPAHSAIVSNLRLAFLIGHSFLHKMGCASQEELNALYERQMIDIASDDFRGHMDLTTTWGCKR